MIIRRPKVSDSDRIHEIAKNHDYPLVNTFETASVTTDDEDKLLCFGVLRSNIEAILYCDGNRLQKAESIKLLIEQGILDAKKLGYSDIYLFAQDNNFADFLKKHFGFRDALGVPLILDIK